MGHLKLVIITSVFWLGIVSACGAIQIKTWFLDGKEEQALIRRKGGAVSEKLTFLEADGYRCYSPEDDKAWRNRLEVCCAGK